MKNFLILVWDKFNFILVCMYVCMYVFIVTFLLSTTINAHLVKKKKLFVTILFVLLPFMFIVYHYCYFTLQHLYSTTVLQQ